MKIFLSPQVSNEENFKYSFNDNVLTVMINNEIDEFDFKGLPNGRLDMYDEKGENLIETSLTVNPLRAAEKKEGVLYLTLLNRIGINATEEEKFPDWINAEDYVFKENPDSITDDEEVENGED